MMVNLNWTKPVGVFLTLVCLADRANGQDIEGLKHAKPVKFSGGIDARGIFAQTSDSVKRYPPSSFLMSGNVNVNIYGVDLPFSFSFANKNRQFAQPFNQFGLSPKYKWVTLHGGYRNITYSPFTLAGHTMLGGGIDLRPGNFRFGFMYGRLSKATVVDTLTRSLTPVSYTRKGMAARIGYGSDKSFIEFSVLKARDDSNSLKVNKAIYDESLLPNAFPGENLVTGVSNRLTIAKKIVFESDAAVSLYTRDITSGLHIDSVDANPIVKSLRDIINVNGTSDLSTAISASLAYKEKNVQLKLQYRRIDPNFKSMGAYFLNTDVENYTFAPSVRLMKNRLRLSGSIGWQNDNLLKLKSATSNRVIGSLIAGLDITNRLGVDVNFSNYSINQQANTTLFHDTLKITQTTYNFSVTPRYILATSTLTHVGIFSFNYMNLNDFNTSYTMDQMARTLNNLNLLASYQLKINKAGTGAGISLNWTELKSDLISDKNYGITLNGDQPFLKNKLVVKTSVSLLQSVRDEDKSRLLNANLQGRWQFIPKHFMVVQGYLINNSPDDANSVKQRQYTETRTEIGYMFNF